MLKYGIPLIGLLGLITFISILVLMWFPVLFWDLFNFIRSLRVLLCLD
jgi:hypothetical protein